MQPEFVSQHPLENQEHRDSFHQKYNSSPFLSEAGLDMATFQSFMSDDSDEIYESRLKSPSPILMDAEQILDSKFKFPQDFHDEFADISCEITKDIDRDKKSDFGGTVARDSSSQLSILEKVKDNKDPAGKSEVMVGNSGYPGSSMKRKRSHSPDVPCAERNEVEGSFHSLTRRSSQCSRSIPDWVKEFDPKLIDELKDFVDFVE